MKGGNSGAKLSTWHRFSILLSLGAVGATGLVVGWARYFGQQEGPFGLENHWIESPARALHGLTASVCLLALGSLAPFHFRAGWGTGTRRRSALMMAGALGILILTGWGLYYAGGDHLRRGLSLTHNGLGLLLLPLFFVHSRSRKG